MVSGTDKGIVADEAPASPGAPSTGLHHMAGDVTAVAADRQEDKVVGEGALQSAALAQELAHARRRIDEQDEEIARLRAEAQQRDRQMARRETQIAAANEARSIADRRVSQFAEQLRTLTASQQSLLENRKLLDTARSDAERELGKMRSELERALQDVTCVQAEQAAQSTELAIVAAALEKASQDIVEVNAEKVAQAIQLADVQAALDKAFHDIAWIDGEKAGQAKEMLGLQAALEQSSHDIAWINGEKEGLKQDLIARDGHVATLSAELHQLGGAKQMLEHRLGEVMGELDHVRHDFVQRQHEVESLHLRLSEANQHLTERQEQLAALEQKGETDEQVQRDQQARIDNLSAEITAANERLAFQNRQLGSARAELADLGQDHATLTRRASAIEAELTSTRERMKTHEVEAARLGLVVQSKISELSGREEELRVVRAGADQLQRQLDAKNQLIEDKSDENRDLLNRLSITESTLRQRQLETEQTAEEIRDARREIEQGVKDRQDLEQQLHRVQDDLLLQKDVLIQSDLDHQNGMKARFAEIATLTGLLADAEDRVSEQVQDMAHLKVARNELARQGRILLRQLSEMTEALLNQAEVKWLPRSVVLRRQRAILKKFSLIDLEWYGHQNPDAAQSDMDVVTHYLTYGRSDGRPFNRATATFDSGVSEFSPES